MNNKHIINIGPITILLLSFICVGMLKSQFLKTFSLEHEAFIEEFEEFMTKNISKDDEKTFEFFLEDWKYDSAFILTKRDDIIEVCNELMQRKSRPFPDFNYYLKAIYTFKNNASVRRYYENWNKASLVFLRDRKVSRTNVLNFLESSPLLFEQNIIFSSNYARWKSSSNNFSIIIEENVVKFQFEKTDLTCYSKTDSLNLYETKGWYNPIENIWHGEGGLVTWERADFKREDVNAILEKYDIELKKSEYTAENVVFTNVFYFEKPLKGSLDDAVRIIKKPEDALYPQFRSYTKLFEIKDFFNNIDYKGGLEMRGAKLVGTGNPEQKAILSLYNKDTLFLKASSVYFAFTKEKITGRNTAITIYLESDSIFHPDLLLTYQADRKELSLMKTEDYTSQSPYFNSYHKVDMNFEQLKWRYGESYLTLTMARGSTIGNANFESSNFFNMNRFMSIQLLDPEHPLIQLRKYSRKINSLEFSGFDYANYLRLPIHQVKQLLMRMSYMGFIFYNFETDEVFIKEKLIAYIESSIGKRDYDVINFTSVTNAPQENAILDLNTFDLTINGMPRVFISDSQNVNIFPAGKQIILKRNRSFQFDGKVEAGLFSFWGNNFFFNYDSFAINLQNIDSIDIRFKTGKKDGYGFDLIGNVESKIEHVTGEVLIDKSDNKSGREHYAQYPIFRSREGSYVYYNDSYIQNGVYKKENFYFSLDPFEIDSLDNFKREGLEFHGTLISSEIFPDIKQTLRLQADNSLGFRHYTDTAGLPIYQGKGNYEDLIWLSNAGLRGNGKLEYLTSVTTSDDFIFLPDSMNTHAQSFEIAKQNTGTQYPYVKSKDNYIHWEPYNDSWLTYQEKGPFTIYNDTTTLTGNLHLKPDGLEGKGMLDMTRATLTSKNFDFRADEFFAKTAGFEVRSLLQGTSVKTDSISAHIDYRARKGNFESIGKLALVEFPENRYITHVDLFTWIMDRQELEFQKTKTDPGEEIRNEGLTGATYISMDPEQDSLKFISPLGIYNYTNNLINARDVQFFHVADALLYPDEGNITIESWGDMRLLKNAKILANTQTEFHQMHSANLTVKSSKKYEGDAKYDYIDENETVQTIFFNEVGVDDSLYTYAKGRIIEQQNFKLSPFYNYQGKVDLHSGKQFLDFNGSLRIVHNCDSVTPYWLNFSTIINPDSIIIPLTEKMKDINGRFIYASSMTRSDSIHLYPAFFTVWENYSDKPIVKPNGYLYFDKISDRFKIASLEKLQDFSIPGNYVSFYRDECELYSEGQVDLNVDLGQMKLSPVGSTMHNVSENDLKLDLLLGVDFHIREDIINTMAKDIDSIPGSTAVDITSNRIRKGFGEIMGMDKTEKYYSDLSMYGLIEQIPEEIKHTIFFNDLKMVWNNESRTYQSIGKIGISNILDKQINKYVDGFVEITRKRSGDMMDIYLQIDKNNWYYFGYTRGVMQVISSNKSFINLIRSLKNKERRAKIKGIKTPYNIIVSTDRKYLLFVRRWEDVKEERRNNGLPE